MAAYCRVDDLRSPSALLPVHRDQLRAQRSVPRMGSLYLYLLPSCYKALMCIYQSYSFYLRDDVQSILKRITGFDLNKIFRERKNWWPRTTKIQAANNKAVGRGARLSYKLRVWILKCLGYMSVKIASRQAVDFFIVVDIVKRFLW